VFGRLAQLGGRGGVRGGEHQPQQGGVAGREADVGGRRRPQPRPVVLAGVVDRRAHLVGQAREPGRGEGVQQRLAVGEVAARRGVADSGLAGEVA
jgi:hypothetical protein